MKKDRIKEEDLPKKINEPIPEKNKKCKKPSFKYELKLWKLQVPDDLFWIIIGTIAQGINGAIFPGY